MKIKNKLLTILLLLAIFIPLNVNARSQYVIPGGETVGIRVDSNGVLIVGFYQVDNTYIGREAGFFLGDNIQKINGNFITSIDHMITIINETPDKEFVFTINRNNEQETLTLNLNADNEGLYKTGLYVKDQVTGIGTLTYIDPETNIFGALGHEILEQNTARKFEVNSGEIFGASVTGFEQPTRGRAGEKRATFDRNNVLGSVNNNSISGIFGEYTNSFPDREKLRVADRSDIRVGDATIRTVLDGNVIESFSINILKIDLNSDIKNILFEITDERLVDTSGGIVQGMSGSPIIQDDKIIGAVTHVIVNNSTKGYGIFITTMMDEGER